MVVLDAAKNSRGFTLIELMITMVVVVLALVGYVGGNIALQAAGQVHFEKSVALQDANRVAEQIRSTAASGQFPGAVVTAFPNNAQVGGFNNLTNEQITVSYANTTADPLDVTITVSWNENGVRPVQEQLRTLVTQRATG